MEEKRIVDEGELYKPTILQRFRNIFGKSSVLAAAGLTAVSPMVTEALDAMSPRYGIVEENQADGSEVTDKKAKPPTLRLDEKLIVPNNYFSDMHPNSFLEKTDKKSESDKKPEEDKLTLRLYSDVRFDKEGFVPSNMIALDYDGARIGYKYDDSYVHYCGILLPVNRILGFDRNLELYAFYSDEKGVEAKLGVRPFKDVNLNVIGSFVRISGDDGFTFVTEYRKDDYEAENNIGCGLGYKKLGDRNEIETFGWARIDKLGGLFLGAGKYLDKNIFVAGFPGMEKLSLQYCRLEEEESVTNQLLFSTYAMLLPARNFLEPTKFPVNAPCSLTGNPTLKFVVPPTSAWGEGWTGSVKHTKSQEAESLDFELVRYFNKLFLGAGYDGEIDNFDEGKIRFPFGYKFGGGDILVRKFFRMVPIYNLESGELSGRIFLEYKF